MKFTSALLAAVPLLGSAVAETSARPNGTSICDYYATALLNASNATTQYTLLTLLVNTVVIGNYSKVNTGVKVPGILAAGTVNGTSVNLLPYFDGGYASTNRNGKAVAVNFLDDGGAAPLMKNMPSNGNTTSNQYKLLTHLYQFFGALVGCSATDYPAYMGGASMYTVHQFMDLDVYQNTYFIQQVGLAAKSFGVADSDITIVANALASLFNYRCLPAATVIPSQGAQLQSICIASNCPLGVNATCASYQNATMPAVANSSLVPSSTASGTGSRTSSMSMTGSATGSATGTAASGSASASSTSRAGAEKAAIGAGAGLLGLAALFL